MAIQAEGSETRTWDPHVIGARMGSIVAASCPDCGLSDQLFLGGGFVDFTTSAMVPAGCSHCQRLVILNAMEPPPRSCPTESCHGEPAIIGAFDETGDKPGDPVFDWRVDDQIGRYVLGPGPYPCPACSGARLGFAFAGNWD